MRNQNRNEIGNSRLATGAHSNGSNAGKNNNIKGMWDKFINTKI